MKRIRVFNSPEELAESAKKNAEYWINKGITFAFGGFGDVFMIAPCDEKGNQTGNGAQLFFESMDIEQRFFEAFRMVVAGKYRVSKMGYMQKVVFAPKKEETAIESQEINGTIMEGQNEAV